MAEKKGGGGKKKSNSKTSLIGLFFSLVMIGVVLAAFQVKNINSLEDAINLAKQKSVEYAKCIPNMTCGLSAAIKDIDADPNKITFPSVDLNEENGKKIDLNLEKVKEKTKGYIGPSAGEPFVTEAGKPVKKSSNKMIDKLKVVNDDSKDVGYSRSEWKHWVRYGDNSCWNTREEVLRINAIPGTVKLLDSSKRPTSNVKTACAIGVNNKGTLTTVNSGKWIDPYSGETFTDSSKLDIDHIIPLSKAARSGGQAWSAKNKQQFANDIENLLAVSAKENRGKSDKGPGEYMPKDKSYHCQYSKSYISIAYKYNLTINKKDYEALKKALKSCEI